MTEKKYFRRVRSFVRREGRLTKGQQRALDELYPRFGVTQDDTRIDFDSLFGNDQPVHVEIGFGNGQALVTMAGEHPQYNYLGIEVHRPGVGNALLQIEQAGLLNMRIVCEDAVEVLKHRIADNSLAAVYIFFPDPWHKKRHHKRRLIQPAFIQLLHRKLQSGGVLHMATDWENYAEHMLQVMTQTDGYANQSPEGGYCARPEYRPVTKFEQRGQRLGHGVWDLVYIKNSE